MDCVVMKTTLYTCNAVNTSGQDRAEREKFNKELKYLAEKGYSLARDCAFCGCPFEKPCDHYYCTKNKKCNGKEDDCGRSAAHVKKKYGKKVYLAPLCRSCNGLHGQCLKINKKSILVHDLKKTIDDYPAKDSK